MMREDGNVVDGKARERERERVRRCGCGRLHSH